MGKYFGTDGFRGEANINLTADHAYKIGRFLGWYYNELKRNKNDYEPAQIVIGKDTRRSSYPTWRRKTNHSVLFYGALLFIFRTAHSSQTHNPVPYVSSSSEGILTH